MPRIWNIPTQFTQGDRLSWYEHLSDYDPTVDTLSCFVRGQSGSLDLTANGTTDGYEFTVSEAQSVSLTTGVYQAQFVIFPGSGGRKALGTAKLQVFPGFQDVTRIDPRTPDEIELEQITQAIIKLATGAVAEYEIGDRRMRYQDLDKLTRRQEYLRRRIAIVSGKVSPGGWNVGARFGS